jgi:hypothetical protein
MLAYRRDERLCRPAESLRSLERRIGDALQGASHDTIRELFIDFGELEAAIADWVFPEKDGLHPITRTLRRGALSAGHALLASWKHDARRMAQALSATRDHLAELDSGGLPGTLPVRVSEGYAFYALHPETYAVAASQFVDERRPEVAVCLGVRSIGTSLSAIVSAALDCVGVRTTLHTVRPHGHPFDRRLVLSDDLAHLLQSQPRHCHFLVVDEGPGLSGSSFSSVVECLTGMGIDPDLIALFPSWDPNPGALRSDRARRIWSSQRWYVADARAAGFSVQQVAGRTDAECIDFSAGAWRPHLLDDEREWPAVQPQHEVPKAWIPDENLVVRFAGLGRYGRLKLQRARQLADAGLGPCPAWFRDGYLSMPFVDGRPCREWTPALLDRIAGHLAFLVRHFPADRSPDVPEIEEMVRTNIRLGVDDGTASPDLTRFRSALGDAPCAAIDGRMLPHEWIASGGSYVKVDALDHHADHFFPGIQDAGWDLAAAAFEFGLDAGGMDRLVTRYISESGDRDIRVRLPFYELGYPAFRLGYATLARDSVHGPDAARFELVIDKCRVRLHNHSSQ